MPSLDMSDALLEPDFQSQFFIIRRAETVDNYGRSQVSLSCIFGCVGIVCAASPNDLERLQEFDTGLKAVSIVTQQALRQSVLGYKPDIVVWQGDSYLVRTVDDYAGYGSGFIQSIGVEMDFNSTPDGFVFGFGPQVGAIRGWGIGNWAQVYPAV